MKSRKDLRSASEALNYELLMLDVTATILSSQAVHGSPLNNALLESFLVHLRNLTDFLYLPKCDKDDILAEDFFDEPEDWLRLRPNQDTILKSAKKRTNKLLAHLTYTRLKIHDPDKRWNFVELRNEILSRVRVFLTHAPRDLVDSKLKSWTQGECDGVCETLRASAGRRNDPGKHI